MIRLLPLLILTFSLANSVLADTNNPSSETKSKESPSSEADPKKSLSSQNNCPNFKFSGYIDGSYNYLVRSNRFTSGLFNRVYDTQRHGLTFHQLGITLAHQPKQGFGALLNVIMGHDAKVTSAFGWRPSGGPNSPAVDPLQAYFQESIGSLTVIGGRFNALVGIESVDPTVNTNFSSGILAGYTQPTTFTGVRGTYTANDKLNLSLGINNGWDNIRDTGRHKTLELSLSHTFNPKLSLTITGCSGEERAIPMTAEGPKGTSTLIDILATITVNDKLTVITNFDFGRQSLASIANEFGIENEDESEEEELFGRSTWIGIAGYINYQLNECWKISVRGEVFDDHSGHVTGVRQTWKEITFTLGYEPIKNLGFRAEVRRDFSNVPSFVTPNGLNVKRNQQSFALEAFYKFS